MGAAPGLAKTWDLSLGGRWSHALRWTLSCAVGRLGDGVLGWESARLQGPSEPQASPTLALVWGWGDTPGWGVWEGLAPFEPAVASASRLGSAGVLSDGSPRPRGVGLDFPTCRAI